MAAKKKARSRNKKRAKSSGETAHGNTARRKSSRARPAPTTPRQSMLDDLDRSGLTPANADKMGCVPLTAAEVRKFGFRFKLPQCYWLPYFDMDGKPIGFARAKVLEAIKGKYRQLKGTRVHFYLSNLLRKSWRKIADDPTVPLYFTEGEKKAAKACREGIPTIGLGGVDCFTTKGKPIPDFDDFEWKDRVVFVVFDSDITNKPKVKSARNRLARVLKDRGTEVQYILLPSHGPKVGLDDYLVAHGRVAFHKLASEALDVPPDWLDAMNEKHFVAQEGTKMLVFEDDDELSALRFEDFRHKYMNRDVPDSETNKALGLAWLEHRDRREYRRVVFDPTGNTKENEYNRWRGLPIEPIQGDWSLMQAHELDIVCRGKKEYYDYLTDWKAFGVQNPSLPTEVAVVLRGEQGTGKGVFAQAYGSLFAPYFYHAASPGEVVGRFTGHLNEKLVLFLDEAFFAGDKAHKGALKRIITEKTITVEHKFRDSIQTRNMLKIIVASNENWVIPADMKERRFFVLDVAPDKMQDTEYFGAIVKQLDNGGREAMMYDLLHRDLSNFNRRAVPHTQALVDQQEQSLGPVAAYIHNLFEIGELPGGSFRKIRAGNDDAPTWEEAPQEIPKRTLHLDFCERSRQRGTNYLPDEAMFAKELKKLLPISVLDDKYARNGVARTAVWVFAPLGTCREKWKRIFSLGRGGRGSGVV